MHSRTQEVLRRDFDETAVAATVGKEEDSLVRHGFGVSGVPTEDLEPGESAYFFLGIYYDESTSIYFGNT
jgi:hypothetical protein